MKPGAVPEAWAIQFSLFHWKEGPSVLLTTFVCSSRENRGVMSAYCGSFPCSAPIFKDIFFLCDCYLDLMLFGIPAFVLLAMGSVQYMQIRRKKNRVPEMRMVDKLLLLFSTLLVVSPLVVMIVQFSVEDVVDPFEWASALYRAVPWLLSIVLFRMESSLMVPTPSWTLFFWWVFSWVGASFKLYRVIRGGVDESFDYRHAVFFVDYAMVLAVTCIGVFSRRKIPRLHSGYTALLSPDSNINRPVSSRKSTSKLEDPFDLENINESNPSLEEDASFWNILTFTWMSPLFVLGAQRQLKKTDFYDLTDEDHTSTLGEKFRKGFVHEKAEMKAPEDFSLMRVLRRGFGGPFILAGVFKLYYDISIFVAPQLLKLILEFMSPDYEGPDWYGWLYVVVMFLNAVVATFFLHQYFHRCFRVGMRVRASLIAAIYEKALRLSPSAKQDRTTGEIVNLMSTDAQRMQDLLPYLHMIWSSIVQIVGAVTFLYFEVQESVFVGVGVMLLVMVPVQGILVSKVRAIQKNLMQAKDTRLKVTNEAISFVKVIKLYAWEKSFGDKINGIRDDEMVYLRQYVLFKAGTQLLWQITPILVSLATFTTYVLQGNDLTPDVAFTALALFNILRFPLAMLPMVINFTVEANVSIKRLIAFFLAEELQCVDQEKKFGPGFRDFMEPDEVVGVKDGNFFWDTAMHLPALKDINFRVRNGNLCMVIGETGSGKSAFLHALIGELMQSEDTKCVVSGDVAYTDQVAWIQNATLRDNILFGKQYDSEWYKTVVHACALRADLDQLPAGDMTEIGEKGINLSGGQKQRVALARAVYRKSKVYLLDDCLSAVDAHVGMHIMTECILGLLATKTVILCTNTLHFLHQASQVVCLKEGRITAKGTYEEIMAMGVDLTKYSDRKVKEEEGEEEEEEEAGEDADEEVSSTLREKSLVKAKSIEPRAGGELVEEEKRAAGSVGTKTYWKYVAAGGGGVIAAVIFFTLVMKNGFDVVLSWWLAEWSDRADRDEFESGPFLAGYGGLSAASIAAVCIVLLCVIVFRLRASREMHHNLLRAILRAPMSFFDTTPTGRILNRFSSDLHGIDNALPDAMMSWLNTLFQVILTVVVIVGVTPWFLVALLPLGIFYYMTLVYYIATTRELKRWASVLNSPIFNNFGETLDGVSSIRAFGDEQRFIMENENRVDGQLQAFYPSISANRWLAVRLEFVGACVVLGASAFAVLASQSGALSAGLAGMSITYALNVTQTLNWMVRMSADMEAAVVAVERISEFTATPSEASLESTPDKKPPQEWPAHGAIEFDDLRMKYRPDLDLVIKGITCRIAPKEKIGVVGRTGAGKSSLFVTMERIVEPWSGTVVVDGVDVREIGLFDLRSRLSIIPQDPVLFTGTVRFNLDPFEKCPEDELWRALRLSHMATHIESLPDGLDAEVSEGGSNFSVGQRQLLCLARALLRKTTILLLDEATSAVDMKTDEMVQDTIREAFRDYTVLTIAHRLQTIMDSDRVMVLEQGKVVEFDTPSNLLNDRDSIFAQIAQQAGQSLSHSPSSSRLDVMQ